MLKTIFKLGIRVATIAGMAYVGYRAAKAMAVPIEEAIEEKKEEYINDGYSETEAEDRCKALKEVGAGASMAGAIAFAGIIGLTMGATWRSDEFAETRKMLGEASMKLTRVSHWLCNYQGWLDDFRQNAANMSLKTDISEIERKRYNNDFTVATLANDWYCAMVMTPATKNGVVGSNYE